MTIAVVYAHPLRESFGSAVLDAVTTGLADDGAEPVDVIDLYADGYHPGGELPAAHQAVLAQSTAIVLVHPTWWTSQPAILLGWMQTASRHRWLGITRVAEVATHGGGRLGNVVAGRAGRCSGARFTDLVSDGHARYRWLPVYGIDRSSASRRTAQLAHVRVVMSRFARERSRRPARPRFSPRLRWRTRPWSSSS